MKRVYGSYISSAEAARAVEDLFHQGYTRDQINVISKDSLEYDLSRSNDLETRDDKYFNSDLEIKDRDILEKYRTKLQNGEIVILIEDMDTFETPVADWDEREREFNDVD
jgi:hypothetical protein